MEDCPYLGAPDRVFDVQHVWRRARIAALARAGYECERCATSDADAVLHVHHIEPVLAGDYSDGCAHHADNLQALCVHCHRLVHENMRARIGAQLRLVA